MDRGAGRDGDADAGSDGAAGGGDGPGADRSRGSPGRSAPGTPPDRATSGRSSDGRDERRDATDAFGPAPGSDPTGPHTSGPEAWQAIEAEIRMADEPWWEADGAPPPVPEDRAWHDREGDGEVRARRTPRSGGLLPWWRALGDRDRTLVLAALALAIFTFAVAVNLVLLAL